MGRPALGAHYFIAFFASLFFLPDAGFIDTWLSHDEGTMSSERRSIHYQ